MRGRALLLAASFLIACLPAGAAPALPAPPRLASDHRESSGHACVMFFL